MQSLRARLRRRNERLKPYCSQRRRMQLNWLLVCTYARKNIPLVKGSLASSSVRGARCCHPSLTASSFNRRER